MNEQRSGPSIRFEEINTSDERYDFVERLLESAFPEEERRDRSQQRHYADRNPLFHSCIITIDNEAQAANGHHPTTPGDSRKAVGLLNYWDFGTGSYIEHFAMMPAERNNGIGGAALDAFMSRSAKVILEAEEPDDELSRRRIAFYERHGLRVVTEIDYIQPPYRPEGLPLQMKLLAHPTLTVEDCQGLRDTIYREVYGIDSTR